MMNIAVFGDSISQGIGSKAISFVEPLKQILLADGLEVNIEKFAETGTTIQYINKIKDQWESIYWDYVIISYGNVDAMLRPNENVKWNLYRHIPKRYKKNGMLNPRPYYSSKLYKKIPQRFDSAFRWRLNRFLLKVQGTTTWVSPEEFQKEYHHVLSCFQKSRVLCCSTVRVCEKYFPGTNAMYERFNEIIKNECDASSNTNYVDFYNTIPNPEGFYDDCFHPNITGYGTIAKTLAEMILSGGVSDCYVEL